MTSNETVAALLEREHRQIDEGLEAFAAPAGDTNEQLGQLTQAIEALRRHIYLEEVLLFPSLRQAGMVAPVFVMLREHGEMWRILDELEALAGSGADRAPMLALCGQLAPLLEAHNLKEEQILYPRTDDVVTGGAAIELTRFLASGRMPGGWVCANAAA